MPRITISYRREDTLDITGRIFDRLAAHFGRDAVFRDIDNIPPGVDFRRHIDEELGKSDIILAIVGPRWIGPRAGQSRLANAADPVRLEIEIALGKDKPVIPVLVSRALMPRLEQLPESLHNFAYRNAVSVDAGQDFDVHIARLIRALDRIIEDKGTGAIDAERSASAEPEPTSGQPGDRLLDQNVLPEPDSALSAEILEARLSAAMAERQEGERQVAKLRGEIAAALLSKEQEVGAIEKRLFDTQRALAKAEGERGDLRKTRDAEAAKVARLQQDNESLTEELTALQTQKQHFDRELLNAREKGSELPAEADAEIAELRRKLNLATVEAASRLKTAVFITALGCFGALGAAVISGYVTIADPKITMPPPTPAPSSVASGPSPAECPAGFHVVGSGCLRNSR